MQYSNRWQGLPYYPISQFYKNKFSEKVIKIPVSVAQSCPNREGIRGMKTCVFCDPWGAAAYPELREKALIAQIEVAKKRVARRSKANQYMIYFQAYTNTFSKTEVLRQHFDIASQVEGVVGFVVGTRPDCISAAVIDLWNEYSEKFFISVELGAQTLNEKQLQWMERGHTAEHTLRSIRRIQNSAQVDLGVHLMFGLPGETDQQLIDTARTLSEYKIDNVKLHNLHVLKNTPLEDLYRQGSFEPIELNEYSRRVTLFLQHLSPDIAVHRLAALSSRKEELIAPDWVSCKMATYQHMINFMKNQNAHQGQYFC